MKTPIVVSLFLALSVLAPEAFAAAGATQAQALRALLASADARAPLSARIDALSAHLLGVPYGLGVSGEGSVDVYDQDPLWRLDRLDCTTYVETVMAAALAHGEQSFEKRLFAIRYEGARVAFLSRNHFAEADWIPNNERAGFVRDITRALFPDLARTTTLVVSKRKWLETRGANDIEPRDREQGQRERLAAELRDQAAHFADQSVTLPYLPTLALFLKNEKSGELEPNLEVLRRVPNGSIFNIVREGWAPGGIATGISHQGFLIQKADGLYMRHASQNKEVREDRIDLYFKRFLNSATIRGINVLEPLAAR